MKKFLSFLGVAILGGIITLGGYKLLEEPVVIERSLEQPIQTFQTNFKPAFETTNATYEPTDFTDAAEKTVHAVVHVKNTAVKTGITSFADLFNGGRQYEQVGTGSGVIISSDGYIVTNNHVIKGASNIEITLNNRKKYEAELIGADAKNDIALLKIDAGGALPYIPFSNSNNVKIGEWVLAVGNPYNLTSTVTAGIVSATGRDLQGNRDVDSFIQTDAAVNPGNSGGALVNTRGELVGINTAISSRTGSYVGYSFAVPSNIAKKIIDDILEFGKVQEAVIGFTVSNTEENIEGVRIAQFQKESLAPKSGLKEGDLIVKINDVKIAKFADLKGQLTAKRPGESVNVTVNRDGSLLTKSVKLIKRVTRRFSQALEMELDDLSADELKKYKLTGGAKVIKEETQYEDDEGFLGYIITAVNGNAVTSAEEAVRLIDGYVSQGARLSLKMINTKGEIVRYRLR